MASTINETIADLVGAIGDFEIASEECCEGGGGVVSEGDSEGDVPVGPGQQFPDQESYLNAKCNAANGIFDTVKGTVDWLDVNGVEAIQGGFGGLTSAFMLALNISGPLGWAVLKIEAALVQLSVVFFSGVFDFGDMSTALADKKDEIILAMYNASDSGIARANFMAALATSSTSLTLVEELLISTMLTGTVMNQLFFPRADVATYQSPSPTDCGAAVLKVWTFPADFEGWTFADISTGSSSASRSYAGPEEAIRNELIVADEPFVIAWGLNTSPAVSIAVTPGRSIQVDHNGTSDAPRISAVDVVANYSDATSEEIHWEGADPTTVILTLTQTKTITSVDVGVLRSTSGTADGSTSTLDILEVRIQ